MILPDVNLLVYAYNSGAPQHEPAKAWWEGLLNKRESVAMPWAVVMGFIRLMTHSRVLARPMWPEVAIDHVERWLARQHIQILEPGPGHMQTLKRLMRAVGVGGALTTDAHLAALAIDYQCVLHSTDADFARFPGLCWTNPLTGQRTVRA